MAARAQALIGRIAVDGAALATSAEVLQEIVHRYRAIDRAGRLQSAFDLLEGIADVVLPLDRDDVARARDIVLSRPELQARDAVHVAVMERHGITRIASFDRGFDAVPGIERLA